MSRRVLGRVDSVAASPVRSLAEVGPENSAVLTFSLQSGSNGNSIYVEAAGVRLLFDAGIPGRTARQRMAHHGRDIRDVDALLVSHHHADHTRCVGVFQRMFGLAVYMSRGTHRARSGLAAG